MQYSIIPTESSRPSCIGFDEKQLLISSETLHVDFDSLVDFTHSFHKSGTNGYAAIPFNEFVGIQYHKRHAEFFIQYKKVGSPKRIKHYLSIISDEVRKEFCSDLAKASGLKIMKEFLQ